MCPRGRPRGQGRPRGLHLCSLLFLKATIFELSSKTINLTKSNILNTFEFKIYGKFANHNLEKMCPRPLPFLPLATRESVLEKSVLRLGLGFSFFFESLALALNVVLSTPPPTFFLAAEFNRLI